MPNRTRSLILLLSAASCLPAQPPDPTQINVRVAGALLGHLGGFCEDQFDQDSKTVRNTSEKTAGQPTTQTHICPDGQSSLGGLLALRNLWSQETAAYKLLTGNNLPKNLGPATSAPAGGVVQTAETDRASGKTLARMTEQSEHHFVFLDQLARLHADVIALGQEDLVRTMLPALDDTPAADIFRSARQFLAQHRADLPFLASNAFIRTKRKNINSIKNGGYELQVGADESIPWGTTDFSVRLPLFEKPADEYSATVCGVPGTSNKSEVLKANGALVKFSIDFLRAGHCDVVLSTKRDGKPGPQFKFTVQADEPLTPFANSAAPATLHDTPAAYLTGHGGAIFAVAMIDTAALSLLESDRWQMEPSKGVVEELVLSDPGQTAKSLFARLGDKENPITVLMSDLSDSGTLQMLRTSSRWRIVTLNPDTALLGCSIGDKGCGKGRDRHSELGAISTIDLKGPHAQVWLRPEWIAESSLRVSGTPGLANTWSGVNASEELVADPFGPIRTNDQPWETRIWWKSTDAVDDVTRAIVYPLMEAMRKTTRAEIAVVDKSMVDVDSAFEIAKEFEATPPIITALRAQQFMEIFWRHDAYVRVSLTGTDLVAMLTAINKLPVVEDGGFCVRGVSVGDAEFGCSIPQNIELGTLRINGRFADANMAYSVAIPQSMAQRLGLGNRHRARTDVLSGLRDFLIHGGLCTVIDCAVPPAAPSTGPAPAPSGPAAPPSPLQKITWLPNPLQRRLMSMIFIPPAAIEVGGQDYRVPLQADGRTPDTSGFSLIPNVNEKVNHTFKFNMVGELHLVPVDHPLLSLDFMSRANLNRVDTYPTTAIGVKQIAYTPDLWTNGVYLRSRQLSDLLNRGLRKLGSPGIFRIEPFVGVFDETSIFHFDGFYQTKETDPNDSSKPRYTFEELDRKPNFLFFSAGIALGDISLAKFLTVKKMSYQFDHGTNYAVPTGLTINSHQYTIDQARRCGIQNLLDKDTATCPKAYDSSAVPDLNIRYTYGQQHLNRHQLAASFEFAQGSGAAKRTITLGIKGNAWQVGSGATSPLDPKYTSEFNIVAALPVGKGITIGPYVRYLLVQTTHASTFMSDRYGFTFAFPFIGKRGAGSTLY